MMGTQARRSPSSAAVKSPPGLPYRSRLAHIEVQRLLKIKAWAKEQRGQQRSDKDVLCRLQDGIKAVLQGSCERTLRFCST